MNEEQNSREPKNSVLNISDVSRLIMPRLNWGHFAIIFSSVGLNLIAALLLHNPFQSVAVAIWLIIPCKDKQFGNGRKYYWMRQSVFIAGTIITALMGVA
jgi:hypothetical protein